MVKRIGVFCAASQKLNDSFYDEAYRIGKWIAKNGFELIYGGADSGSMECMARGASEHSGIITGVVPRILETRRKVSQYVTDIIPCENLNDRKQIMISRSDVLVALPGGIGTLDEIFTLMAANSIGYQNKPIILYNESGFWDSLLALLQELDRKSFVNTPYDKYLSVVHSLDELDFLLKNKSE